MKPLKIDNLYKLNVRNLSSGELQRVAITLCLGKPANVFLLDEPSVRLRNLQKHSLNKKNIELNCENLCRLASTVSSE